MPVDFFSNRFGFLLARGFWRKGILAINNMTNYFLDNPMYIGTPDANRFSVGYYRNYTFNIACRTLNWRISSFYYDSGDFISYDLRICAQHSLSKSCYS